MLRPAIVINELDAERLDVLLEQPAFAESEIADKLKDELDRAEILSPQEIPADIVTMNSQVRFRDLLNGEEYVRTLVYPASLKDSAAQISVMAPIGAALLGLRVGSNIIWQLPNGETQIEVLEILYQPEAAGEFHR
ncbi:MAG: nucleoside diphosphate kinase regulator [Enterobacteriaceae bacterium]